MKATTGKLLVALSLAIIFCVIFISCGSAQIENTPPETTTVPSVGTDAPPADGTDAPADTTEPTTPATPTEVKKPENYTFEQIFTAPDKDKRDIVVDYMLKMATIEWTPAEDFVTTHAPGEERDYSVNLKYTAGKKYYGVPYANTKADYFQFTEYLNGDKFACDNYYYNYIIGNHCSSSMFLAYQQIIPVGYGTLRPSEARQGIFKLCGDLKNPGPGTWYSKDVWELNGEEAVYKAFATVDKGDILFKCIPGSGHTRMISKPAEIFKSAAGKVVQSRSFIYVIEQTNAWYDSNNNSTWWVDKKYTFSDLWNKEFMPITLDAFHEDKDVPVQDAYIWFTGSNKADQITTKLLGQVSSNFPLNYVMITIKDANGNIVQRVSEMNLTEVYAVDIFRTLYTKLNFKDLAAGEYTYILTAGIARGNCEIEKFNFTVA